MKITVKKMGGAKVEVAIEDTVRRLARARARHLSPASPLPVVCAWRPGSSRAHPVPQLKALRRVWRAR
jgi:hypothetical protein